MVALKYTYKSGRKGLNTHILVYFVLLVNHVCGWKSLNTHPHIFCSQWETVTADAVNGIEKLSGNVQQETPLRM